MHPTRLRTQWLTDPIGLDERQPQLSWELVSRRRGVRQTAYQVMVAHELADAQQGRGTLWDTGRVASADTLGIPYDGPPVSSGQRCWWTVRVWDETGAVSDVSPPAYWEMGLLDPRDWQAQWITAPPEQLAPVSPSHEMAVADDWRGVRPVQLRRRFEATAPVVSARVYATARGLYELELNGRRVGEDLLRPGWTDYRQRIQYQSYDVTGLIDPGANTLGLLLATGWYSGRVAWKNEVYGTTPSALVQLELTYADGTTQRVCSDDGWVSHPSPLLWSDLLMGEAVDCRLVDPAWSSPRGDDAGWSPVVVIDAPEAALVADAAPRVRRLLELPARSVVPSPDGGWLVDLGQNMVGWARLRLAGPAGKVVSIRYAEMLEADGRLHTANLRTARATDHVVLAGDPVELEPHFTTHGFRYLEIAGLEQRPELSDVTGVVVGSDIPEAGSFTCSHPLVNQLYSNIVWGQRGNFLEVPTDCPQRDERLGWTGDAAIFLGTAAFNADVSAFFAKWYQDLKDTQRPDGAFGDVAPLVSEDLFAAAAPGWGDAGVIVPWVLFERYGDRRQLERDYPAMRAWVDYVHKANPSLLWLESRGMDYGDWLSLEAETPRDLVATAYFARSVQLVTRAAEVLGQAGEAAFYGRLAEDVAAAFQAAYVTPSGRVVGHTQTAYVLALAFDLLPAELRPAAADFLVADINHVEGIADRERSRRTGHLSTGFLGIRELLPVLTAAGRLDVAYQLLENETCPSWLYPVTQGATTVWERWNAWTVEGGFNGHGMNSFNHYSYGAVGEWLFTTVAGLAPAAGAEGFDRVLVRPRPGGSLTCASARHTSVRGEIAVGWALEDGVFALDLTVPPNVRAEVWVPTTDPAGVRESGVPAAEAPGVVCGSPADGAAVFLVGAGSYRFMASHA